jgi:peptidoglycan/LPS O-acetylase OafA/YrhL
MSVSATPLAQPAPAPSDARGVSQAAETDRFHALDALRAVAMLLGIVLHGAMSFVQPPVPIWPAVDRARSELLGGLVLALHAFRLQVFFVMAGFFAHLVMARRGLLGFVWHRTKRIVVPLALSAIVIVPITQATFVLGQRRLAEPAEITIGDKHFTDFLAYQRSDSVLEFFTSGRFISKFMWFHLWFLWYLVVIYGLALLALPLGRWLGRLCWPDRVFRWIVRSPWQPALLAVPTFLLMLPMITWQADSPMRLLPEWRIVFYYAGFFGFGWLLYRHRDLLADCGRWWKWYLVLGLLVFPGMGWLFLHAPLVAKPPDPAYRLPTIAVYALFTWLMALGCLGLFQRYFSRRSFALRYMADSAYWLYLAHLPVVVLLQILMADWPGSVTMKFLALNVIAIALLLASYHWSVRYTWLGTLLNGRRG